MRSERIKAKFAFQEKLRILEAANDANAAYVTKWTWNFTFQHHLIIISVQVRLRLRWRRRAAMVSRVQFLWRYKRRQRASRAVQYLWRRRVYRCEHQQSLLQLVIMCLAAKGWADRLAQAEEARCKTDQRWGKLRVSCVMMLALPGI
jgi:hypothetical protein